jgi:hypothetical protein
MVFISHLTVRTRDLNELNLAMLAGLVEAIFTKIYLFASFTKVKSKSKNRFKKIVVPMKHKKYQVL